ncbi:MAG: PKD domain-containing protein [Nitrospiraceae bacterium]|nr:MAG: PKD domain-containing protein [Nitrospiraceae bacterium]
MKGKERDMMRNLKKHRLVIGLIFCLILLPGSGLWAGSANLSWGEPTTNVDETPLTDLFGYKIYYGTTSGTYSYNIDIGNVTSYEVTDLTDGTIYYFAVTAYDTSGNESGYSGEVSKTLPLPSSPPVADPGGPYTGIEGQALTFNGSASSDPDGIISLYEWDVNNDGIYDYSSSSPTGSHIYAQQGIYTVALRVTDNFDKTDVATATVTVSDTAPAAGFTGSPTSGAAPLAVNFTNTSTGYDLLLTYAWDFDNNGTTDSTLPNPSYVYGSEGTYSVKLTVTDSDGSATSFASTNYVTVRNDNKTIGCSEGGVVECIERLDGGSDGNNLVNKKPKLNLGFKFRVTVTDTTGVPPRYVRLFMSQRSNPSEGDFYYYDMLCSGDYTSGASCTYATKLGPAAVHKYYFESSMSDGTTLRYPVAGYITGPATYLLSGYNLVGLPRDIGMSSLTSNTAFGTSLAYRWDAEAEYYSAITASETVRTGEGYFIYRQTNYLPELAAYAEIQDETFTYGLRHGWNIISNPYSGNVALSDVKVRKGEDTPVTWTQAASTGWLTNAIYFLNGKDWGNTYGFESAPSAQIVPWVGYWIYLNASDDTYYLVITRPENRR